MSILSPLSIAGVAQTPVTTGAPGCALLCSCFPAKFHTNSHTHTHNPFPLGEQMGMCEHMCARTHTHTHSNTGETSQKIIPTTSTAIGHLDCFHNFPLKYYFSRKRLTETLSFRFYTRTSSVLFPPNKYQIKSLFSILLPFPKCPSLCFLLFTTCMSMLP